MKHILPLIAASALCISTASAHPADKPPTQNETAMTTHTLTSKYSFDETVSRLETAIKSKGMDIFAVIDHQEAARRKTDTKNRRRISPSPTYGGWKSNAHAPHSPEVGNPSGWVTVISNHCRNGRFRIPAFAGMTGVCVLPYHRQLCRKSYLSPVCLLVSIRHKPNAV